MTSSEPSTPTFATSASAAGLRNSEIATELHSGQLLHTPDDCGEVLFATLSLFHREHLLRRRDRRDGYRLLPGQSLDVQQILVHEPQRELDGVFAGAHVLELVLLTGRDDRRLLQYVKELRPIQTSALAEHDRLGQRLDTHAQQAVDDELHR